MVPAAASAVTTASSTSGTSSASTREPNVVRTPAVLFRSLIAVGTPCSGGSSPPSRTAWSARAAAARAWSAVTVMNAPICGSSASIRARQCSTSSVGLTSFARTAAACSSAVRSCSCVPVEEVTLGQARPGGQYPDVDLSRAAAAALDDADPLADFRARFTGTDDDGADRLLYLDGNSLGRLPTDTAAAVARVVEEEWGHG